MTGHLITQRNLKKSKIDTIYGPLRNTCGFLKAPNSFSLYQFAWSYHSKVPQTLQLKQKLISHNSEARDPQSASRVSIFWGLSPCLVDTCLLPSPFALVILLLGPRERELKVKTGFFHLNRKSVRHQSTRPLVSC